MSAIEQLEARADEREALVQRITDALRADYRVLAAALTGSYARGETDGLSDVDILVVVRDRSVEDFVPARQREVERFAPVMWSQDVPDNAPPGGAYLGVGFEGTGFPLCTDWYWWPRSVAAFPTPSLVLFEQAPIPRSDHASMTEIVTAGRKTADPPPPSPDLMPKDATAAKWTFDLSMIFRMTGVASSRIARGSPEEAEKIAEQLESRLQDLTGDVVDTDANGFERLRELCHRVEVLVPQAVELGAMVPEHRAWLTQTIDFMEALTAEGWRSER